MSTFRRYVVYERHEQIILIVYAIVLGFLFSFNRWGGDTVSYISGLTNLVQFSAIAFVVLLLFYSLIKYAAGLVHHSTKIVASRWAVIFTLIITFVFQGSLYFFVPAFIRLDAHGGNILGGVNQKTTLRHYTFTAMVGIMIFSIISWVLIRIESTHLFIEFAPTMMLFLIIYSLVPFDAVLGYIKREEVSKELRGAISVGTAMFYRSIFVYVFLLLFVILGYFFVQFLSVIVTVVLTLLLSIVISLFYFFKKEIE